MNKTKSERKVTRCGKNKESDVRFVFRVLVMTLRETEWAKAILNDEG